MDGLDGGRKGGQLLDIWLVIFALVYLVVVF